MASRSYGWKKVCETLVTTIGRIRLRLESLGFMHMSSVVDFHALLRAERERSRQLLSGKKTNTSLQEDQAANEGAKSRSNIKGGSSSGYGCSDVRAELDTRKQLLESIDTVTVNSINKIALNPSIHEKSLDDFILDCPLKNVYYVPNILANDAVEVLHEGILSAVSDKAWHSLKTRRLQCWGGVVGVDTVGSASPKYLNVLGDLLVDQFKVFDDLTRPNHFLINQYDINQGILPHQDGPLYHPKVAILSLNEHCIFTFYRYIPADSDESRDQAPVCALLLRPNSLLVFSGDAYFTHLHGIEGVRKEIVDGRGGVVVNKVLSKCSVGDVVERTRKRTSLTVRHVPWQENIDKQRKE